MTKLYVPTADLTEEWFPQALISFLHKKTGFFLFSGAVFLHKSSMEMIKIVSVIDISSVKVVLQDKFFIDDCKGVAKRE